MAVIWSHWADGNLYEVRSAGATLRLYRNGVNHSQWNPNRPLGGSIWDLIALPALHRPVGSLRDGLMLGFGAGTVARQLCDLAGLKRIVGVEVDPMHLSIAQGFFECSECCELVAADAVEWIYEEKEEALYDLIIDDLYSEEGGVPVRCAPLGLKWFTTLGKLLRPGGIFVFNVIEPEIIGHLPLISNKKLNQRFPYCKIYQMDGYENRVLAFSDRPFVENDLISSIRSICQQYPRCYGVGRRYKSSDLSEVISSG